MAKSKGQTTKKKKARSNQPIRTRENRSEFRQAAKGNQLLRQAFQEFIANASDQGVSGYLTRRMSSVIKTDAVHRRGDRVITIKPLRLLEGFNFNHNAPLTNVFFAPYDFQVDRKAGSLRIDFPFFNPHTMTVGTKEPYDFFLMAAVTSIDFKEQEIHFQQQFAQLFSNSDRETRPFQVLLPIPPGFIHPLIVVLGLEIISEHGPDTDTLRQKKLSALSIVRVFT